MESEVQIIRSIDKARTAVYTLEGGQALDGSTESEVIS
jgi:hypothetical protein